MGLFSFLKNAGAKLFNKEEKQATSNTASNADSTDKFNRQRASLLEGVVTGLNLPVDNLDISFSGETVTVRGEVTSHADREKIILALGNVEGVSAVEDHIEVNAPEPKREPTFYEVKKGDSLSKIAKAHYGDAMKYTQIFEANKPMLKDPDLIYPGQMLRIPDLNA